MKIFLRVIFLLLQLLGCLLFKPTKNIKIANIWIRRNCNLCAFWWEYKMLQPVRKSAWEFHKKLNMIQEFHWGIHTQEIAKQGLSQMFIYLPIFRVTCTVTRKSRNNPMFVNRWMDKQNLVYSCNRTLLNLRNVSYCYTCRVLVSVGRDALGMDCDDGRTIM